MRIYEFGMNHKKTLLMFQCAVEPTWMFYASAEALAKEYHVFLAAAKGLDPSEKTDFTSVEEYASRSADALHKRGIDHLDALYGVSMGGAAAMYLLAHQLLQVDKAIIDAGITPYPYPKAVCYLLSMRDDCLIPLATISLKEMKIIMPEERWTPEGIDSNVHYQKLYDFFKHHYSKKTNHNTFWSANNYDMLSFIPALHTKIEYWYGSEEKRDRKRDLAYVKKAFPNTVFQEMPGFAHAELVLIHPIQFAEKALAFFKTWEFSVSDNLYTDIPIFQSHSERVEMIYQYR